MAIEKVVRTEYICGLCGYVHREPVEHCHICNDGEPTSWTLPVNELEVMRRKLADALTCPVCGLPKVHSRLRGYHCHNEEHNR